MLLGGRCPRTYALWTTPFVCTTTIDLPFLMSHNVASVAGGDRIPRSPLTSSEKHQLALQSRNLVMLALGADGLLPQVEDGIHLRWQMDLNRGFPPYGFDLFRRPHLPPTLLPFAAQARPDGVVPLNATFRAFSAPGRS